MWKVDKEQESAIQCSLIKSPTVYIEPIPRQKIQLLMSEYTHQEWLAYLKGRISEKDNIFVEDILVPPHAEASGGSAEAEPFHIPKDCVGIIHSHHGMGAFHSGTDQSYVDKNFPVSITVARGNGDLTFDAVSYTQTPCGKGTTLKSSVKYVQPQLPFDKDTFLKESKKNIDKGKRVYVRTEGEYDYGVAGCMGRGFEAKPNAGERPYVPVRYRLPSPKDITVDGRGHPLSQTEIDDIRFNSEEG